MAIKSKASQRARRHARIRKYVSGTAARPRLCVTRSSRHMFVQVIDDVKGVTLASASTMEAELRAATDLDKTAKAKRVGELVEERRAGGLCLVVELDRRIPACDGAGGHLSLPAAGAHGAVRFAASGRAR